MANNSKTRLSPVEPYAYQETIIEKVVNALCAKKRALFVMATGTGKTLVSAFAIQRLIGKPSRRRRILFLAHMTDLLVQARDEYRKVFPDTKSAFITNKDKGGLNADIPLVFATFQSLKNLLKSFRPSDFELIAVDEGHHAKAGTYRGVIKFFSPEYLLGMTATPDREDGEDIREIFGEEVATLTLAEAMAKQYVCPVKYRVLSVASAKVQREVLEQARNRNISYSEAEERLFQNVAAEALTGNFLEKIAEGNLVTTIFASSIDEAISIATQIRQSFPLRRTECYHSDEKKLDSKRRREILADFKSRKISFLVVVDALNEGVDIPTLDRLVFLRSTESATIFLQQLGRGLRYVPGKTVEVLDFVGNLDRVRMLQELLQELRRVEGGVDRPNPGAGGGYFTGRHPKMVFDLCGFDFSEVTDVVEALTFLKKDFYPSLEEASTAAQNLGVSLSNAEEYRVYYRRDSRLPSRPEVFYAASWEGWPKFLGTVVVRGRTKDFYPTYEEASKAAQRLGIRLVGEYKRQRRKDPKLPSHPARFYGSVWKGWPEFLGRFYSTYEEAMQAARALGVKKKVDYQSSYGRDPKLPFNPDVKYASSWISWPDFLGTRKLDFAPRLCCGVFRI